MQESRADFGEMGVQVNGDNAGEEPPTPAAAIATLEAEQTRVLQAIKKAVWDVGRVLIGDSRQWKALMEEPEKDGE